MEKKRRALVKKSSSLPDTSEQHKPDIIVCSMAKKSSLIDLLNSNNKIIKKARLLHHPLPIRKRTANLHS